MEEIQKSVRPACSTDATRIGTIQARAMHELIVQVIGAPITNATRTQLNAENFAQTWQNTINTLPSPNHHVLVAINAAEICGFSALIPCEPLDFSQLNPTQEVSENRTAYEITNFDFSSEFIGQDHEARMLAAITDIVRDANGNEIYIWVFAGDELRARILNEVGFAPCGARRNFIIDEHEVTQHLWWTTLAN